MSWIPNKSSEPGKATISTKTATSVAGQTRSNVQSLEMPIVMSVRRLPAPVYATLMDITAAGAQIRSLILMERGTEVEFDLAVGNTPLSVAGRVHQRRNAPSGARFEYYVTFDSMPEARLDGLARHVRDLERRTAAARSTQAAIAALPTTDANRRSSYRALTAFPIDFRREGELPYAQGRVGDLSSTGIRMNCECSISIGTLLETRFTLPSSVLDVYPEETASIDMTGPIPRRIGRADMRRPFEEMFQRGRVVTRFSPVRDREVYGVAFLEIDGYAREEIARFTHALQLSKLRNS